MNDTLKAIATKYEIEPERISEILREMDVKNLNNPGKRQIEGLEKVCALLKEGQSMEEAIAEVVTEAKKKTVSSTPQVNAPPPSTEQSTLDASIFSGATITIDDEPPQKDEVIEEASSSTTTETIDLSFTPSQNQVATEPLPSSIPGLNIDGLTSSEEIDAWIDAQANQAANSVLQAFPSLAGAELKRVKAKFIEALRQKILRLASQPEFQQQFEAAIAGQAIPKNLLGDTTKIIALPNKSSSSS